MVHVFCLDKKCRRVIHLDNHKHWDFKGKVKCSKCGAEMDVEIKNGELRFSKKT
ncbi:hypothetical protein GWO13_00125 [Candidatus Bathyarchaeota archaeon]|nr:hypothetical protein [Candidatus Bathyarchaeota archaeon]